jgi:hypothetical protein
MAVPRIPAHKPIVVEPVEAKTYPDKYIMGLVIRKQGEAQPCEVYLQAYNFDTKELSDDDTTIERFRLKDIWLESERSPVFAAAMQKVIEVIMVEYKEKALLAEIALLPEGKERDALIVQLRAVEELLQVPPNELPKPFVEEERWAKPLEK